MLGIFASTTWNPAASGGVDGLLRGGTHFFGPVGALTIASAWAFLFTLGMLWIIEQITPVKVTGATEEVGLDQGIHGEKGYAISRRGPGTYAGPMGSPRNLKVTMYFSTLRPSVILVPPPTAAAPHPPGTRESTSARPLWAGPLVGQNED